MQAHQLSSITIEPEETYQYLPAGLEGKGTILSKLAVTISVPMSSKIVPPH